MGVPEMQALWNRLVRGRREGTLTAEEDELADRFGRALGHLRDDPRHPGLQSHEIDDLTRRYGRKVFQSYLENHTPAAGRFYWVYGPAQGEIAIIGLEPHPEDDKRGGYDRVRLSRLPPRRPG
jgi:hypothetical protein